MNGPDPALLADLDAGLLDPAHAREVRAAALADPRAAAVLDALRATRADLAALPAPTVPPALSDRWLAALVNADRPATGPGRVEGGPTTPDPTTPCPAGSAAEPTAAEPTAAEPTGSEPTSAEPTSVDHTAADHTASDPPAAGPRRRAPGRPAGHRSPAGHPQPGRPATGRPTPGPAGVGDHPHRSGHRSRSPRGPGRPRAPRGRRIAVTSLLAAAALVVGVVVAVMGERGSAVDVTRVDLAAVARSTIGRTDLGVYTDAARRDTCLATAGHAGAVVQGGRTVRLDGTPGVLLVLSTGVLGRFRVLVVDDECRTLADDVLGR